MGIGTIIAVSTTLIILFVGAYIAFNFFTTTIADNSYCENWYNSIEQRSMEMENRIAEHNNAGLWQQLQTDTDYLNGQVAALNAEAQQYNRDCYY